MREVSLIVVTFHLFQQKFVIQTISKTVQLLFVRFTFTLSTSQFFVIKKWCGFVKIYKFQNFLSHGSHKNNPRFRPSSNNTSSNCLSHNSPAKRWLYRFHWRGTTGSSMLDHDVGHFASWKTHRNIWLDSDLGILRPSNFTWVEAHTASAARPSQPSNLGDPNIWSFRFWEFWAIWEHPPILPECRQILQHNLRILHDVHDFCSNHLGHRRALFSENCVGSRVVFYNVSQQHDSAFALWVPTPHFWGDKCPSMKQSGFQNNLVLALPSWDCSIPCPRIFSIRNLHRLWHRTKLAHQIVMCDWCKSVTCSKILFWSPFHCHCFKSLSLSSPSFCTASWEFMFSVV